MWTAVSSFVERVRRRFASPRVRSLEASEVLHEEFLHLSGGKWIPAQGATLQETFAHIHGLPSDERPSALCLSGGGIRSATLSLGVLQSFANSGRLLRFDYLSTVSGGGYIGSWLSNWRLQHKWQWSAVLGGLRTEPRQGGPEADPHEGAEEEERNAISRLRAYSNYLSPIWGLSTDALSLVAIFLRNLLLNWLVWVPLLAGVVTLPRLYVALVAHRLQAADLSIVLVVTASVLIIVGIAFVFADLPGQSLDPTRDEHKGAQSRFAICCFAPIALASVVLSISGAWTSESLDAREWYFPLGGVFAHVVGIVIGVYWRRRRRLSPRPPASLQGSVLVVLTGAFGGLCLWAAMRYAGPPIDAPDDQVLVYATLSVPLMLACFWGTMCLYAGLSGRWTTEEDREWWARATAWWLYASVVWVLTFALVLYLPPWTFDQLSRKFPPAAQLGVGGTLLGVATSAFGYWGKNGADLKRRAQGFLQATGLHLLDLMAAAVIVIALVGMSLAMSWTFEHCHKLNLLSGVCVSDLGSESSYVRDEIVVTALADETAAPTGRSAAGQAYRHVMLHSSSGAVALAIAALFAVSLIMSAAIGANTFSLHGMYGNRLVRAYLGAGRRFRNPNWFTGFDPKDNTRLHEVLPPHGQRLFQVINIALNLVRPSNHRLAWQQRKASSFTATPLHCGADGVGYVPTRAYGADDGKGMSLGRALTISGAAASPNMGYHSSALVTFVMTLFNVRLGWWLPNPGKKWSAKWNSAEPAMGFYALFNEAFGRTTDDRSSVYLSDGGHFENLGIYEMVRRRCHRIVVVDATCDPKFEYADLQDAVRKIRVDFGIDIELPPVLPGPGRTSAHPRRVVGRIRYSMRDGNSPDADGFLYLIKPRLLGDEPPDLAQYAASMQDGEGPFPHQSTADQFFDETQFESYRMLGVVSAKAAFPDRADAWPEEDDRNHLGQTDATAAARSLEAGAVAPSTLSEAVHNFGTGAALAAALTVGGTLGVVGTVTVAPGEVRLSSEDRTMLQKGIKVNLALDLDQPSVRVIVDNTQSALIELRLAVDKLRAATGGAGQGGGSDDRLVGLLETLLAIEREMLRLIEKLVAKPDVTRTGLTAADLAKEVTRLTSRLDSMIDGIKGIGGQESSPGGRTTAAAGRPASGAVTNASLADIATELKAVQTKLDDVKKEIARTNPRSNIRGQEGAQR